MSGLIVSKGAVVARRPLLKDGIFSLAIPLLVLASLLFSALNLYASPMQNVLSTSVQVNNGGIDFNAAGVNMEIQMSEDGFVFPKVDPAMLEKFQVNGLQMNVIQFRPLGMPVIRQMLGMEPNSKDKDSDVGQIPSEKATRQEIAGAL